MKGSGLEHVIFRPSFVFGPGGGALQQFARIAKLAPVTPIVGPGTQRIQPIWIDDVAAYFAAGVEKPEAANRTFELGGPDVVTWNEFWSRLKTRARDPAAGDPRAVRPDAGPGRRAREAAEAARHARPAEDAGGRRQRRLELGRRRHLRPPARPPRRATPPRNGVNAYLRAVNQRREVSEPERRTPSGVCATRDPLLRMLGHAPTGQTKGRFRGPSVFGTSLYWQGRFRPIASGAKREPPTLARRFPLQVQGTRPYRLAPPLPVLEISTAGPPPFRGYPECSRRQRRTMSAMSRRIDFEDEALVVRFDGLDAFDDADAGGAHPLHGGRLRLDRADRSARRSSPSRSACRRPRSGSTQRGRFREHGRWSFFDVDDGERAVVLDLTGHEYRRARPDRRRSDESFVQKLRERLPDHG